MGIQEIQAEGSWSKCEIEMFSYPLEMGKNQRGTCPSPQGSKGQLRERGGGGVSNKGDVREKQPASRTITGEPILGHLFQLLFPYH